MNNYEKSPEFKRRQNFMLSNEIDSMDMNILKINESQNELNNKNTKLFLIPN